MKRQHKPKHKHVPGSGAMQPASSFPHAQQQQLVSEGGVEDSPLLVLHILRILALYLYVLLSRHHDHDTLNLRDLFFPPTKAIELLMENTLQQIEQQLHTAIIACVQGEIASNQFDGLVQEKTVFTVIKRIFRVQKVKAAVQCQLLSRLLNRYLSQLSSSPIVHCDAAGTLASTLEYLSNHTRNEREMKVSHSLLYPLVNAIDSLSIEQRECLDALTTLWRWVAACDPSEQLLDRIIDTHHAVIFCIDAVVPASPSTSTNTLGACFVRALVHHADHVFRHDLGFTDPLDLLTSDSETDADDEPTTPETPSTPPFKPVHQLPTLSPSTSTRATKAATKKSNQKPHMSKTAKTPSPQKVLSPKVVAAATEIDDAPLLLDANEPAPASMMRVGIAAAAGTLAAALCVIFT